MIKWQLIGHSTAKGSTNCIRSCTCYLLSEANRSGVLQGFVERRINELSSTYFTWLNNFLCNFRLMLKVFFITDWNTFLLSVSLILFHPVTTKFQVFLSDIHRACYITYNMTYWWQLLLGIPNINGLFSNWHNSCRITKCTLVSHCILAWHFSGRYQLDWHTVVFAPVLCSWQFFHQNRVRYCPF
jgi:hypothetical protein